MGNIITFYSYKGGTGRTMTLANVAVLLAQWGYKVLMIDWDLEAPGLDCYFNKYADMTGIHKRKGIVDILYNLKDGTVKDIETFDWKPFVFDIPWKPFGSKSHLPEDLHLLTAGQRTPDYFAKVKNLDLRSLYLNQEGGVFIENLRKAWKEAYDYILIDSRSGVTDIQGVCAVQLPDILVMFLTANEQSLQGTFGILKEVKLSRQDLPFRRSTALRALPIPNRLDMREEFQEGQKWLDRFADEISEFYDNWLPSKMNRREFLEKTKIPYIPYFSFGEKLAVLEKGANDSTGMGYPCETLAALLANDLENVEQLVENRDDFIRSVSIGERSIGEKLLKHEVIKAQSHKRFWGLLGRQGSFFRIWVDLLDLPAGVEIKDPSKLIMLKHGETISSELNNRVVAQLVTP